jgi:type II secretory pathway predicted ATPase ExeA
MLLQYFGFQQDPFGATPDPRCLYLSGTHREALASLEFGFLSNRGFTAMIAPPGMGKTTLLCRFLEGARTTARTVFLFDVDAECEPKEFVAYIFRDIGITPAQSSSEMHEQLTGALAKENRAGRKFVVVIDEAQNLSDAVLERVRLLTNFETSRGKLMQVVLSGQPQLSDKLMRPSLVQLRQRISTICRLNPLSTEETIAYIGFRLKLAGYEGEPLFTEDALKLIAEASGGIPRIINNLCFNALSICRALNSKQVDARMAHEAIADLQLIPQAGAPVPAVARATPEEPGQPEQRKLKKPALKFWIPATATLLIVCVLSALWFTGSWIPWSHAAADDPAYDPKVPVASIPAPAAADNEETKPPETAPDNTPFAITVKPDQTLQNISEQYLGGFDIQRLHQILALNPKLTDPDHIEVGQRILLPGLPSPPAAMNATPQSGERNSP